MTEQEKENIYEAFNWIGIYVMMNEWHIALSTNKRFEWHDDINGTETELVFVISSQQINTSDVFTDRFDISIIAYANKKLDEIIMDRTCYLSSSRKNRRHF